MPIGSQGGFSRLQQAREGQNAMADMFGSFLRSTVSGLTGGHLTEVPGLEDLPEAAEGIGRTISDIAGNIAGSAISIGAGSSLAGVGLAALGFTGPLAPIIGGTIAGLAYAGLEKADLETKAKDGAVAAIIGAAAGALKLRGIGKAVQGLAEGAETIKKAKALGNVDDFIIQGGKEVIDELKMYAHKKALPDKNLSTTLFNVVKDFQQDPMEVGKAMPKVVEKVLAKHALRENGLIKDEWLHDMSAAQNVVKEEVTKILATQAHLRGQELVDNWNNASMIGKTWGAIKGGLADPGNLLASRPNGGMIFQMADDSVFARDYLRTSAKINFEPFYEKLAKMSKKNPEEYKALSERVTAALENRENAASILKNDFETDVYNGFKGSYDFWMQNMEKMGLKVRKDYVPHLTEMIKDPKSILGQDMPQELSEGFFGARKGQLKDFVRDDLIRVYNTYENFASRKIAYDPVIKLWKEKGSDPIIGKFLNGVVANRRIEGGVIDWITGQKYLNLVARNPFSAASNLAQQGLAEGHVSGEAFRLSKQLRKINDPEIVEYLNRSFSKFAESVIPKEILEGQSKGFAKNILDKMNFFEMAEGRNWMASRAMGVSEELVQSSKYQQLIKSGKNLQDAAFQTLKESPDLWKRAMTRGSDLASKTQFSMAQGFKPALFELVAENPLLRIPLQFARFQASNLEATINLLRSSLPGKLGSAGKELSIMRRGFQDEASVVQRLQAMRDLAKGAKSLLKEVPEAERGILKNMVKELGQDMGFLRQEVARVEPRSMLNTAEGLGKMIVGGSAPKLARTWLKWGLAGYIFNKEYTPEKKAGDIATVIGGQIPGLETVRGMDLNPRYIDPRYNMVSNTVSVIPGIGYVDALIPGRPITRAAFDRLGELFSPEKKKKSKKRRRGL